jgi:putative intracellular protease/amidase
MSESASTRTAWVVIAEGWADHQTALACAEIAANDGCRIRYAGLDVEPIASATGMRTLPDCTVDDIAPDNACILILPGGPLWEERDVPAVTAAVRTFREHDLPIAAIGSGTLALARAGVLGGIRHTSNGLAYLKEHIPEYRDDLHYVNVIDVADSGLITAHEAGSVDFAHEIIKLLDLRDEPERRAWYRLHREGVLPPLL